MAKRYDFKKGQLVWHTASPSSKTKFNEGIVTSVGPKFVTVNNRHRFYIETLLEDKNYGIKGKLYLEKQDYLVRVERKENLQKIKKLLESNGDITLEQTRQILSILN